MLQHASFIEHPDALIREYTKYDPTPVFKKRFTVENAQKAVLDFCAPSLGKVYLNGKEITEDVLISPVSDYRKTLWFNRYDVTHLLQDGENELTVILGNGLYNESLKTGWDFDTAEWRNKPTFALACAITCDENEITILSDESWYCDKKCSPLLFTQFRSGETYDCRLGQGFLKTPTENFRHAVVAQTPKGELRECLCPPIREFERLKPVKVMTNASGRVVYDFGQNQSGYVEITLKGNAGDEVVLRHSERILEDGTLNHNGMDGFPFFQGPEYQTDRIILSGETDTYKPFFTYHGFRYVEIEGIEEQNIKSIYSVFVHQAVDSITYLSTSNETINRLFAASKMSVWSNLFYTLTDCPTREKLGWTNDAIASLEQLYYNFDIHTFFEKWLQDVLDSQSDEGEIPSIVPTWGWGLESTTSCIGPLCSGIICELPFAMYQATGDLSPLQRSYDAMRRHMKWIEGKEGKDGFVAYGLGDWMGPFHYKNPPASKEYITTAQYLRLLQITMQTGILLDTPDSDIEQKYHTLYHKFMERYYDAEQDRCLTNSQSAVAMMINLRKEGHTEGLKAQLRQTVLDKDCHHDCGMVSMRHLYTALRNCGLDEYAWRIVTAKGFPSYNDWLEDGATTLYENWNNEKSNNHHMNSCVIAWIMKALLGVERESISQDKLTIRPYFPQDMTYCKGKLLGATVDWSKTENGVCYHIILPENVTACLQSPKGYTTETTLLQGGTHTIHFIKEV